MRSSFSPSLFLCLFVLPLLSSCGDSAPLALVSPATPTVTGLNPSQAMMGTTNVELDVLGDHFRTDFRVAWEGVALPTTVVSAQRLKTTLPASLLEDFGTFTVTAVSHQGEPAVGQGSFEVLVPTPSITAISPPGTLVGEAFSLEISGEGLYEGTIVRFGASQLPAVLVDSATLLVQVAAQQVATVGEIPISLLNPDPLGGASDTLALSVYPASSSLGFLSSRGATVGGSGFDLGIYGTGFRPGARAFWNGEARPTTRISHREVRAAISASDVASPGIATITVENPSPGGPAEGSLEITVRSLGAVSGTLVTVDLPTWDIGYSTATGLLYVSVRSTSDTLADAIAAIDPIAGTLEGSVHVGNQPETLAISDDGSKLWVGLAESHEITGVDLPSLQVGPVFPVPLGAAEGGEAEEIEVLPGATGTIAVSVDRRGGPRYGGVYIFDDGIVRPQDAYGFTGANTFDVDETGEWIYGYDNETSAFDFHTLAVDAAGVRPVSAVRGLISGFYHRVRYGGGRIYATSGEVVDAREALSLGNTGFPGEAIAVDVELGRVFVLAEDVIVVLDLNTWEPLGYLSFTRAASLFFLHRRQRLIRWGTDGLAFRDAQRIYAIRTPLAAE